MESCRLLEKGTINVHTRAIQERKWQRVMLKHTGKRKGKLPAAMGAKNRQGNTCSLGWKEP